jgi:hypothetical protein
MVKNGEEARRPELGFAGARERKKKGGVAARAFPAVALGYL